MNTRKAGLPQSLLLLLGSCLPVLGAVLIAPILPKIQEHFHTNEMAAVLVPISLTIPALMIALFSPVAGMIADKFGRKRILLISMLIYGVFGILPIWLPSLEAIVLSRAGLGIAEAAIMTCCTTLMGDYYDGKKRERIFALQMVATSFSAVIFISAGGLIGQDNWRSPFTLYAAAFIFFPLMAYFFWEPSKRQASAATQAVGESIPWSKLTPYYFLTIVAGISLFIVPVQASYLLNKLDVTNPAQIGMTMGFNQLGILVGAVLFQLLPGHIRVGILKLSLLVIAAGCIFMGIAQHHLLFTVAVTINGFGIGLIMPTLITCIMSFVAFEQRGRVTGVFTAMLFLGEFVSPIIVLAITKGNAAVIPQALYIIAAALVAIVAVISIRVLRVHPPIVQSENDYKVS